MKAQCIAYPMKLLLFCRLLLVFQNKARIADCSDNEFTAKSLFVYDNSLYSLIVS